MVVGGTTIGPIAPDLRDELKDYRDEMGFSNYNETIQHLLERAETDPEAHLTDDGGER